MQSVGIGMSKYFNEKYVEKGSVFQGPYRAKIIDNDLYLRHASAYIQIKNAFELYPKGKSEALLNFDTAYKWATENPYISLGDYAGIRSSPTFDKGILGEIFTPSKYKSFARDYIFGRMPEIPKSEFELE